MSAVLIGVESWDALVSATVVMILGLTCTAAALLPALKAIRVDPVGGAASGVSSMSNVPTYDMGGRRA